MRQSRLRIGPDQILLGAVFLTLSISTALWTRADKSPPSWDPSDHLIAAYDYYRPIAHGQISGFAHEFFSSMHYYAPLVHLTSGFFFLIFGASRLSGIAVNLLSLAITLGSVWWMGNHIYARNGKRESSDAHDAVPADTEQGDNAGLHISAGAIAAVFAVCYHFPAWLLHDAFLDYPLMAIVTLSFALLINAGDFRVRRDAVIFGISAGLGLLVKQTFPFFFVLPAIYLVARAILTRDGKALANLVLAGTIAGLIAAIWYAPHIKDVIAIYRINQKGAIDENEAPLFSFMSNVVYLHGLVSYQIQAVFGLVFIAGMIFSIARYRRQSVLLYLWVASGIIGFTLVANKDIRYTVPVLPAVALISVAWIGSDGVRLGLPGLFKRAHRSAESVPSESAAVRRRPWRLSSRTVEFLKLAATAGLLVWAGVSFFNAQWPAPGMGRYIDTPRFRWMVNARNYFGFDHAPFSNDWSVPEVISTITN
ncbi:MAG TPA: hypothetical protein VI756_30215, partial [Blastocatellia bacterium]